MKKGFSYIQLLTYLSIILILILIVNRSLFGLVKNSLTQLQLLKEKKEITKTLDYIANDIAFAETLTVKNNTFEFSKDGINYIYLLRNRRIARKKNSYFYITPKTINITKFEPQKIASKMYSLEITANDQNYVRKIRWQN